MWCFLFHESVSCFFVNYHEPGFGFGQGAVLCKLSRDNKVQTITVTENYADPAD